MRSLPGSFNRKRNVNDPKTPPRASPSGERFIFGLLVFAQFAFVGLLVFGSNPVNPKWFAWFVSSSGLVLGLSAICTMGRFNISPRLKPNAKLMTKGPYALVRHPMYLALLIYCGGYLINHFTQTSLALWLGLLLVLACKINYEERILRTQFSEYATYAKRTKRIVPFIF